MREYRALLGPVAVVVIAVSAMIWSPFEPHGSPVLPEADEGEGVGEARALWADEDWAVFEGRVREAIERGLDDAPLGRAVVEIGRSFVGTAYVPRTLEVEGPERLVINFLGLDCVTFVENTLAIARFVRSGAGARLSERPWAEARYEELLAELRYRGGVLDGYPSRLHYFSEWISDNAGRGLVEDVTPALGGIRDAEPIDFMSTHPDAYRQLADPGNVARILETEETLTAAGRFFIPQRAIEAATGGIEDGDVIAATSTVTGLDVAHTGLAVWVDGTLRLMHAPLVGDSVQISDVSLAERIGGISGQDGVIVARPMER